MSATRAAGDTAPEMSVIIPAYNSERTIGRCLKCLAVQRTRCRFEVIVVHSGDDRTSERVAEVLPSARVIQLPTRETASAARNIGVKFARGRILAFVDSDAYPDELWVDRAADAAAVGYDLVCGSIENANPQSRVSRAEQLLMFNEFLPDALPQPSWFALSGNMTLTRDAYERFGPFAETRAAEDIIFSRRLLAAGGRILFYPALRVYHDNRTRIGPYLRNQVLLGLHTGVARRIVDFDDTTSYALFLAALPVAPLVKFMKIAVRLYRRDARLLRRLIKELPLFFAGICAYSLGMVASVFQRVPRAARPARAIAAR